MPIPTRNPSWLQWVYRIVLDLDTHREIKDKNVRDLIFGSSRRIIQKAFGYLDISAMIAFFFAQPSIGVPTMHFVHRLRKMATVKVHE